MNKEPECVQWLRNTGRPSPRTCKIWGIGPCTYTAPSNIKQAARDAIKTILKYIEESSK